jgi:hypothetical protein
LTSEFEKTRIELFIGRTFKENLDADGHWYYGSPGLSPPGFHGQNLKRDKGLYCPGG